MDSLRIELEDFQKKEKKKMREFLEKSNCDGMLVLSPQNRMYFTGFKSSMGFLVLTKEQSYFITDSRYMEMAEQKIDGNIKVVKFEMSPYGTAFDLFKKHNAKKIGIEAGYVTISSKTALDKFGGDFEFEHVDSAIAGIRKIKRQDEIDKMKKAQAITDKAFAEILKFAKVGVSEWEIKVQLDYIVAKMGGENAFDTIVASGENGSMPHAQPSSRKVKQGDGITIDFGAKVDGYCSDMTRTFFLGSPSSAMERIYNTVLEAQLSAMKIIKAGEVCSKVDKVARDIIDATEYKGRFEHTLGHSIGVDVHERPTFSPSDMSVLEENMVLSVEPGIYVPNLGGVRIEDLVVVKKDGYENLTHTPKDLLVI